MAFASKFVAARAAILGAMALAACQVDDRPITPIETDASGGGPGNTSAHSNSETTSGNNGAVGGSTGNVSTTSSAGGSGSGGTTSSGSGGTGGSSGGSATEATTATASTDGGSMGGARNSTANVTSGGGGGASSTTTSASSTTGEELCLLTAPATAPVALAPEDGWVPCEDNSVGIQGAFFTYHDEGGSTIEPEDFQASGTDICVTGEVAMILDGDYSTYFGSGVGFNLHQEPPDYEVVAWNADTAGISGFSFTLSAMPKDTLVRFQIQSGGLDYCVSVTEAGEHTVMITDALAECWSNSGDTPDPTTIETIKWVVITDEEESHTFDFCISDLQALP